MYKNQSRMIVGLEPNNTIGCPGRWRAPQPRIDAIVEFGEQAVRTLYDKGAGLMRKGGPVESIPE